MLLSDKNWLLRCILLESIAGVPGMVGGTLRHLRSLRLLVSHLSFFFCHVTSVVKEEKDRADEAETRWWMDPHFTRRSRERANAPPVRTPHSAFPRAKLTSRTFMTISQPTFFTRALVLAAQGGFYNAFFLTYLISPKTAHRFVGALEEEAVRT